MIDDDFGKGAGIGRSLRVAILSDTHGVLDARIAEQVAACDIAVHGGDVGSAAILAALQPRSGQVLAVSGNNDTPGKWPSADRAVLAGLPVDARLDLPGGVLAVVHGHRHGAVARRHQRLRRDYPDVRAIVYGHSHRLVVDTDEQPWVLNPGAAGRARTYGGPSLLVLAIDSGDWRVSERRFPKAR